MVAKDSNGGNVAVPGLLIEDTHGIRRFARSKIRKLAAFQRDTQFDEQTFRPEEHLELLEEENIKLAIGRYL